jgi:hypothetical protein
MLEGSAVRIKEGTWHSSLPAPPSSFKGATMYPLWIVWVYIFMGVRPSAKKEGNVYYPDFKKEKK